MKGIGTKDDSLIRCVLSRVEVDMVQIKQHFEATYKQPLGKMIVVCLRLVPMHVSCHVSFFQDDLSGDYKRLVLALVGEEKYSKK
jgi:hypothetical protein